jgi:hypothetical protein
MNWVKRRLRNWVNNVDSMGKIGIQSSNGIAYVTENETLSTEPIRISIYRANGGTVVETRIYDRQKDRSQNQLHIVGHDQDLGHSLAKIITMESLR